MRIVCVFLCTAFFLFFQQVYGQQKLELLSPDKRIKVELSLEGGIYYTLYGEQLPLLERNRLSLTVDGDILGDNPVLISTERGKVAEVIKPVVPLKFGSINNNYNYLRLKFKNGYAIEFRAFEDGVAYRFTTSKKGSVEVLGEQFSLNLPENYRLHMQQPAGFKTAYEELYTHIYAKDWKLEDRMATLPILIDTKNGYKLLVSESDLSDYPCMFLKRTEKGINSVFPKTPLVFAPDGDRSLKIVKEASYIAKTKGARSFPWRYFVVAKEDKQLIENTMTLKLAPKCEIQDVSWIQPGQASWEWWNDAAPYGPDVNFVSGYNLDTYKYYIDFAAKYGVKYIIMDEGWAKSTTDPYTPNPSVDLHEIIRYGKQKNVGVVLWLTWLTVQNNMELFKTFNSWGVKGLKIDFMDRSDQIMVNYYENVAAEAAKYNLLVDFHGAFKPAGLEYKYPNVISYEGVRGMEQMENTTPDNSVYLPFIRNAVGPMDYTPGAMISMQPEVYKAMRPNAASIGTRSYQLSLFVIFESGMQMLADNPTLYYRNEDCTEFITSVPTTWDDTRVLSATLGEAVLVAKRKKDKWFIGGITNNKEKSREFTLSFDFLDKNRNYTMTYFEDGINADRQAMDYRKKTMVIKKGDKIKILMARNGGWAARLD